jgi:hypothetical protein
MIPIQGSCTANSIRILRLCSAKRFQHPDYGYYLTVISTKACPNLITRQRNGGHPFALHCEAASNRIFFAGYFNNSFSTETTLASHFMWGMASWRPRVIQDKFSYNNSIQFFIIYVLNQQPQGQLQSQHSVVTYGTNKTWSQRLIKGKHINAYKETNKESNNNNSNNNNNNCNSNNTNL